MFDSRIARGRDPGQIHDLIDLGQKLKMSRRAGSDTFAVGQISRKKGFHFSSGQIRWQRVLPIIFERQFQIKGNRRIIGGIEGP